jgi:hypothetical protein
MQVVLVSLPPGYACSPRFVTERYLRRAYGGHEGCVKAQASGSAANALRSYRARIYSDTATVRVRPSGGVYDGERITVSLVREGRDWKIDALHSNVPVGP